MWSHTRIASSRLRTNGSGHRGSFQNISNQRCCADRLNPPPSSSRAKNRDGVARQGFALQTTRGFRFVEEHSETFPVERLCRVMNVSPRGLRAIRRRPASRRQRTDMVVLAHIKEQSRLSLGSYALPGRRMPSSAVRGRPRMTEELKDVGVDVGHRRVGRLMRENGIVVERTRKFKATTDSNHMFNIAPNLLDRDFHAPVPNQKCPFMVSRQTTAG